MASDEHRADTLLKAVIGRVRMIDATTGLVILCAAALGYLLVEVFLDHAFVLQKQVRIPLWTVLKLGAGIAFLLFVMWPMARRIGPMFAAKRIEDAVPGANNELITYLDIRDDESVDRSIARAVRRRAAQLSANVRVDQVVDGTCVLRACSALAIVVAVLAIYSLVSPKSVLTSLRRAVLPGRTIAPPSRTQIVAVLPGDQNVLAGSVADIQTHIKGRHPDSVDLWWSGGGQRWQALLLTEGEKGCWAGRLQVTGREVDYYIAAGDTKSDRYKLTAVHEPAVVQVTARLVPPDYTGLAERRTKDGNIQALVGTKATVQAGFNNPVQEAMLVFESGAKLRCALVESKMAEVQVQVAEDDTYWVSCTDKYGGSNRSPVKYKITALPDQPPTLTLRSPECDLALPQNAELLVDFEASDDYGLASAKFVYANDKGGSGAVPIDIEPGARQVGLQIGVPVSTIGVAGDKVRYHLEVEDALQPVAQRATSESRRLDILATEPGQQIATARQPEEREDIAEDKPEDEDRQEGEQEDDRQEGEQELLAKDPVKELQETIEEDREAIDTIIDYLDEQNQGQEEPQQQEDAPAEDEQKAGERAQQEAPVDEQAGEEDPRGDEQEDDADGQRQQGDLQADAADQDPAGGERVPGEQDQQPGEANTQGDQQDQAGQGQNREGHDDPGQGQDAGQGEQDGRERDSMDDGAQDPRTVGDDGQARDGEASALREDGQGQPGEDAEGNQDGQGEPGQDDEQQAGGEQGQGGQGGSGQGEQGESGQSQGGQGQSGQSEGGQSQGGQGQSGQSEDGQSQGGQSQGGQSQGGQSQGGQGQSGQSEGGQSQGGQGQSGQGEGGQSQGGQGQSGQSEGGQSQSGQSSGAQSAGGGHAGQREQGMADQGHTARGLESLREGEGRPMDVTQIRGMVERLAGQVQRGEVAPELLERLDWNGADLHSFVTKYKRRLKALRSADEKAKAAPDALEPTKGHLGEHKRTLRIVKGTGLDKAVRSQDGKTDQPIQKDEIRDLFEAKKDTVSVEYRDLVEAYYKSLAGDE